MTKNYKYYWLGALVFLLALIIRLYFVFLPGHEGDSLWFAKWTKAATESGIAFVYDKTSSDYPPGLFYIFKPLGYIYKNFFSQEFADTVLLRILLKIPGLVADLVTFAIIFIFLCRWRSPQIAFGSASLYALNPGIIYVSAYWGQVDSLNTLFMLASVLFLMRQRIILSWAMLTISLLIKMHGLILLPIIFYGSWLKTTWKRMVIAACTSLIIILFVLLPFLRHGQTSHIVHAYTNAVGSYPFISVNAYNLWWLLQPQDVQKNGLNFLEGHSDNKPLWAGITYKHIGLVCLGLLTLCVLFSLRIQENPSMIALAAAAMTFAYFMLPTQIHERYLFPAFALLSIIYHEDKHLKIIYWLLTFNFLLNLQQVMEFSDPNFPVLTQILSAIHEFPYISSIISLSNIIVFMYFIVIFIRFLLFKKLKPYDNIISAN